MVDVSGSQLFYDTAGSRDKTLKLYEGHFHDLLNDLGKEIVIADIKSWIEARVTGVRPGATVHDAVKGNVVAQV